MSPRTRADASRRAAAGAPRRAAVLVMATLLGLTGCAGVRPEGEPLVAEEMQAALDALAARSVVPSGFRCTGEARLAFSGRTLKTTFAAMYDRPGWLRADMRPSYGSLGASLTAQAVVEAGCARVYFPAKLVEVTGCLSDLAVGASSLDPAALVLGLADASLITQLDDLTAHRGGDRLFFAGSAGQADVLVVVDERVPAIASIEIRGDDVDDVLTVRYDGYGWKERLGIPRTVTLSASEGTTREIDIEIRYATARATDPVSRAAHALSVPAGVLEIDWRELSIWR